MADLRNDFVGIKSPNPFWLASAPPTDKEYNVVRAFKAGWGGVVWKTLGLDPHIVNVGQLHSSHNPTLEKRFVVTLALFHLNGHRLLWSDALKKFENYYDN